MHIDPAVAVRGDIAVPGEDLTAALPPVAASLPVDDVIESLPVD